MSFEIILRKTPKRLNKLSPRSYDKMSAKKNPLYTTRFHGEHHMGASSLDFELEKAIKGIKTFRTTNGRALQDQSGRFLLLYDAVAALILDFHDHTVHHLVFSSAEQSQELTLVENALCLSGSPASKTRKCLCPDLTSKTGLAQGFGPVRNGKFPSAYP